MKKVLLLSALILSISITYSQQKKKKKTVIQPSSSSVYDSSDITKDSKWIAKFKLQGKVYNVYLKHQKELSSEQTAADTLLQYHFVYQNARYSVLQIPKYSTIDGKISAEGSYKVKGDTLITSVNYYDPYHRGNLTTKYVPDKQSWFREINYVMKGIDTDTVSNRYIKTAKMNVPYSGKN